MSKRLQEMIAHNVANEKKMLSLYLMAGFPEFSATPKILNACEQAGVDFVELGIPFSDPIADGPVIQKAAQTALKQGVTLQKILEMVKQFRATSALPIILMGYLNPVYQFGLEAFFNACADVGVDGLILPDWPIEESEPFLPLLESLNLDLIHLIAPNTPRERIKTIDHWSKAFIYCTAYTGVTGKDNRPSPRLETFLKKLTTSLSHPFFIGFGVKAASDFKFYTQYSAGVIIGSAFLRFLNQLDSKDLVREVRRFVNNIRGSDDSL